VSSVSSSVIRKYTRCIYARFRVGIKKFDLMKHLMGLRKHLMVDEYNYKEFTNQKVLRNDSYLENHKTITLLVFFSKM